MKAGARIESNTGTLKMLAHKEAGVGWMTYNQPEKRNAVSMEMWAAVPAIIADFEADPSIRAIVLSGAGDRAFIAGADISEFGEKRNDPKNIKAYEDATAGAHRALVNCKKPTIAMIQGYCVGGGVAVALSCDLRLAADDSRFAVPAARLGLGYGAGGIRRLMDIVGPAFAKEIFFTARMFDAGEAAQMGLVNRVVPVDEIEKYTREYTQMIAANAPLTLKAAKMAVDECLKDPERRDMGSVAEAVAACFASADYVEGRTAFMEKRQPNFQGK